MATTLKVVQDINLPDSATGQNIHWVQAAETLVEADIANVEADIDAWLKQAYERMTTTVADKVSYGGYRLYTVNLATGDETYYSGGDATISPGGNVNDCHPNGVAGLIGFLLFGRPRPAAKFLPGFSEGAATDNNWSAGVIAAMLLMALDLRAGPGAIGTPNFTWTSGVYSRVDNIFVPASATAYANTVAAYQRRRKPGVGI